MTRFGVMKHLRLLEKAGLVVTRRSGREKLHYLNAVPIRMIHDRWIDKYTEHRCRRSSISKLNWRTRNAGQHASERRKRNYAGSRDLHQGPGPGHLGCDHEPGVEREIRLSLGAVLRAAARWLVQGQRPMPECWQWDFRPPSSTAKSSNPFHRVGSCRRFGSSSLMSRSRRVHPNHLEIETTTGGFCRLTLTHEQENAPLMAAATASPFSSAVAVGGTGFSAT